jgi:hypothetical protein
VKRNPTVGNMSFWVGLFIGFPMLNIGCVAQLRHGPWLAARLTPPSAPLAARSYILF